MPFALLIGGLAGLATSIALMAATRGNPLFGALLLMLAPLPTLIAGLGWGLVSAAAAGLVGALVLGAIGGLKLGAASVIALAAPCAALTYLTYLSRPKTGGGGGRDWYPAGRLLAALALIGGAVPIAILPLMGGSYAVLIEPYVELLKQLGRLGSADGSFAAFRAMSDAELASTARIMATVTPGMLAAYWTVFFAINLYLAGRVARTSGRLVRDWPDLAALTLPRAMLALFGLAIGAMTLPGVASVIATSYTGSLAIAFAIGGLAVLHAIARGRWPWLLWLVYGSFVLTVLGAITMLVAIALGVLEPLLGLRRRLPPPPPPRPPPPTGT